MHRYPIAAVIFDMGGVIIDDRALKEDAFAIFNSISREEFWRIFNEYAMPACRGEERLADCWMKVAAHVGIELSPRTAEALWIDNFKSKLTVDGGVIKIIDDLKRRRYKLGMVSNTLHEHAVIIREMGLYDYFDAVILSHEVKMTKDNPDIFQIVLRQLGVEGSSSIFIDDVEKFAQSAAGVGISPIVFSSAIQLREELTQRKIL